VVWKWFKGIQGVSVETELNVVPTGIREGVTLSGSFGRGIVGFILGRRQRFIDMFLLATI